MDLEMLSVGGFKLRFYDRCQQTLNYNMLLIGSANSESELSEGENALTQIHA